jgi:hypothetical protein
MLCILLVLSLSNTLKIQSLLGLIRLIKAPSSAEEGGWQQFAFIPTEKSTILQPITVRPSPVGKYRTGTGTVPIQITPMKLQLPT